MFLHKKHYIGNKWKESEKQVKVTVLKEQTGVCFPLGSIKNERISEITEEVMYWRKANAIHNWFVTTIQKGKDDCGSYYVSKEQLQKLRKTVTKVIESSELVVGDVINGYYYGENGKKISMTGIGKIIKDPTVARQLLPGGIFLWEPGL